MAGISISGLASGLDIDSIIQQIMDFEARPMQRLQRQVDRQNIVMGAYENFETKLLALKVDFARLARESTFLSRITTSTDENVLTATASTNAARGTFTITVDRMAQTHQVVSKGYASTTSAVGTGTFSLTVGDRQQVDITVDSSNNSLQGLADAINDAKAGATASIVNTGDISQPYVLLITGDETGQNERIIIDANLVGVPDPMFGEVLGVVEGTKQGTTTITSSGSYTGNSNGTLSYTVQTGGTIGIDNIVIDYDDGNGATGSFVIPAGYTPGDKINAYGSVELSFSAGTLTSGTFSTDVTSSSIQSPVDAAFTLGNTIGGATGITLTSASNTVSNVIEGLTIELHKVDANPVTITVDEDIDSMIAEVEQLVTQYNGFVDLIGEVFFVEEEGDEIGALLGERAAINMYAEVQRLVTSVADGVGTSIKSLGGIGITVVSDGKLALNTGRLRTALEADTSAVFNVFGTAGQTTDGDIRFMRAGSQTAAFSTGKPATHMYDVFIARAAEKASVIGTQVAAPTALSPLVVDSSNSGFKITMGNRSTGDLKLSEGAYASGEALALEMQNKVNADGSLGKDAIFVSYVDDGGGQGHFEFTSGAYGESAHIRLEAGAGNSIYTAIGHTSGSEDTGVDVAGTINGEAGTGSGQILTGNDDNEFTDGLQLLVTISTAELASQGNDQGTVTVTKGIASRQADALARMTDIEKGDVRIRKDAISGHIESTQASIDRLAARLEKRRVRLVAEFLAMETALSNLESQQGFLQQGLASLAATSSQVTSKKS